ncbi:MAG: NYN domain-containing protein [Candidatus Metalachnospira sp.]|nr:NYN domain-containing protein [Candidatus Metalachnospira sp.]
MKNIRELENIAVLIDADNAQSSKIKLILDEISAYGRVTVKKAFGNWKDPILKNWEDVVKSLAIKPEQQFAYTKGKNATDILLIINALDLLHTNNYDAFVLVASDSDYTPLAIRLRESGVFVLGVGEKKTPESFKNACDEFLLTENLKGTDTEVELSENKSSIPESLEQADIEEVHKLLVMAYEKYQDDDGYVNVSSAGTYIKRIKPDFDALTYGFAKLPDLLQNYPNKYEIKKYKGKGTVNIIAYKCK